MLVRPLLRICQWMACTTFRVRPLWILDPSPKVVPSRKQPPSCSYLHNWLFFQVQVKPLLSACQRMACAALGGRPVKMVGPSPKTAPSRGQSLSCSSKVKTTQSFTFWIILKTGILYSNKSVVLISRKHHKNDNPEKWKNKQELNPMFPILREHTFAQVMAHNKTKEKAPN